MDLDTIVDKLRGVLDSFTKSEWLSTAMTIIIVVVVTIVVTAILTKMLRALLTKGKGPLPSSSIFINILRITTWAIAFCVILSSCFNVNVGALVTALGVGGIAVSLGAQSILSNLFAGLQVSLTGLVKPGDRIQLNSQSGTVRDVTWSYTSVENSNGEHVIIPNSILTSTAMVRLLPANKVKIPLYVTTIPQEGGLSQLAADAEDAVNKAVGARFPMKSPAKIVFSGTDNMAIIGSLTFELKDRRDATSATDLAIRVSAPYVHVTNIVKSEALIENAVESTETIESAATDKKKVAQKRAAEKKHEAQVEAAENHRKHGLRSRLFGRARRSLRASRKSSGTQSTAKKGEQSDS